MTTHASVQTMAAARAAANSPSNRVPAFGIALLCAFIGAGLWAGARNRQVDGTNAPVYMAPTAARSPDQIAALRQRLGQLGMRRIAVCEGECAARPALAGVDVAARSLQAVIFDGSTANAAAFVHALRTRGSFAMVVLTSSVDPAGLVRALPPADATWLAVAVRGNVPEAGAAEADRIGLAVLAGSGAIVN